MRKPKSHVTILLGIMCGVGRREKRIECRRWLHRIKPVSLVDRGALGDEPTVGATLDAIEETGKRGQVGLHCAELLAHADDDGRLGYGAILRKLDGRGEQMVARPGAARGKTRAAALDELFERAAKPRHRNMSIRREGAAQLSP